MDNWIFFEEIDFTDADIKLINVDTRDFHALPLTDFECESFLWKEDKWGHLKPDFFFSDTEIKALVNHVFTESGGKGSWRCLTLTGRGAFHCQGWLKYLRIHRTPKGWLVLNSDSSRAISNLVFLECPINKEFLDTH